MKTNLLTAAIAATAIVGLSGAALAQATGPAAQDNTKMNKDMSKDGMSKGGMKAGDFQHGAHHRCQHRPVAEADDDTAGAEGQGIQFRISQALID